MRFEFINAEKANYPVRVMCRVLQVSRSGYYAHIDRAPSHRHSEDAKLKPHIQAAHTKSRGTYGRLRVVKELVQQGLEVGKHRVARLMREIGLRGVPQKALPQDDQQPTRQAGGTERVGSSFRGRAAQLVLDDGHHLHSDLGGVAVPSRSSRPVFAPRRRLGDAVAPQD